MFRHIVVPIDLSNRNSRALEVAAELAEAGGARLTLVHVVEELAGIPPAELKEFYDRLRDKAATKLARALAAMKRADEGDRIEVLSGDPASEIVAYASRRRADLIVIGSHSVDPRAKASRRVGWGTTSYKVALLCRCPVMLVKSGVGP